MVHIIDRNLLQENKGGLDPCFIHSAWMLVGADSGCVVYFEVRSEKGVLLFTLNVVKVT